MMIKKQAIEKYWLVLLKYYLKLPALVRYCIESIQTNPNSQNWNDKKLVLKMPLRVSQKGS